MSSGSVYIDASLRDIERATVIVFGRVKLGHNATINPQDLGLRTITSITFNPWPGPDNWALGSSGSAAAKDYFREFRSMNGSIGSLGVFDTSAGPNPATPLGNYVRVKAYRMRSQGSLVSRSGYKGTFGLYIGTQAGSMRASYTAVGL